MRTIVLTEVETPLGTGTSQGSGSYWALIENGRITDGLGKDELLWAVAHALIGSDQPYRGGQTMEQLKKQSYQQGVHDARNDKVKQHLDPDNEPF
jgi:hypothetical protein